MKKNRIIFALDLGTTKFCMAALKISPTEKSLDIFEVPAAGMKRGMLVDFNEARNALNQLVEKIEKSLKTDVREVVVGVAGSHLRGKTIEKLLSIGDKEISDSHLDTLLDKAELSAKEDGRELLHCIPVHFKIDDREPIMNPVGLSGNSLSARYFIIDADLSYLKDMIRLCNLAALKVTQVYSEPFASASVTVDDTQKDVGIAVADIGGGTTDGIVYQKGRPVDVFTVNIAGSLMSQDLSAAFMIGPHQAESLKTEVGLLGEVGRDISFQDLNGKSITRSSLECSDVLGSRVLELGAYLASSLRPYKGQLAGGLLFTGGGSRLKGLNEFLAARFKINVETAWPDCEKLGVSRELGGRYATVIGLLNLEVGRLKTSSEENQNWASKYLVSFFNWMKELS